MEEHLPRQAGGTASGGRVHPRTRVGGGARWKQVLFEGGRRKLACGLPNEKRTQETRGGAGMQGAVGDRMEFLRRQLPPARRGRLLWGKVRPQKGPVLRMGGEIMAFCPQIRPVLRMEGEIRRSSFDKLRNRRRMTGSGCRKLAVGVEDFREVADGAVGEAGEGGEAERTAGDDLVRIGHGEVVEGVLGHGLALLEAER